MRDENSAVLGAPDAPAFVGGGIGSARCTLYVSLIAAHLLSSAWVAAGPQPVAGALRPCWPARRMLPAPHGASTSPVSAFSRPGRIEAVLGANPRVAILPFSIKGPSSYWQAENGFGFTQDGGYLGFPPRGMQAYPAVLQLYSGKFSSHFTSDFADFCRRTGAQYVIAGPGTIPAEWAALSTLDWRAQRIDDVTVFTVPPQ